MTLKCQGEWVVSEDKPLGTSRKDGLSRKILAPLLNLPPRGAYSYAKQVVQQLNLLNARGANMVIYGIYILYIYIFFYSPNYPTPPIVGKSQKSKSTSRLILALIILALYCQIRTESCCIRLLKAWLNVVLFLEVVFAAMVLSDSIYIYTTSVGLCFMVFTQRIGKHKGPSSTEYHFWSTHWGMATGSTEPESQPFHAQKRV